MACADFILTLDMISIITAVRNHLAMNRLYVEKLKQYSSLPYELIVIDNASTDGSAEFFEAEGATVVRNRGNYSYPHCQNQGIQLAQYDLFAFFNNDLIVCPGWDQLLTSILREQQLDFISPASNDRVENTAATRQIVKRWKYVKYPMRFLFGDGYRSLKAMHHLMYGNWEQYCRRRLKRFGTSVIEDFSGSCLLASRSGMDKMGGAWDERVQAADFDMYMQVRRRSLNAGDIRPMQVATGVFFHHYSRLTLRSRHYQPFEDAQSLISIEQKWGDERKLLLEKLDTDAGKA